MGEPSALMLRISAQSGSVRVTAEDRHDIDISGAKASHTTLAGVETWTVEHESGSIRARVPFGTDVLVGSHSGSVKVRGATGRTVVTTRSGTVEIEDASEADVRVESGSVRLGDCEGSCCIRCGSGSVRVKSAGSVDVHAESGTVRVDEARGDTTIRTVSGKVTVDLVGAHDADVESISGTVRISVPANVGVQLDADTDSGRVKSSITEGNDSVIKVRTATGKISVVADEH